MANLDFLMTLDEDDEVELPSGRDGEDSDDESGKRRKIKGKHEQKKAADLNPNFQFEDGVAGTSRVRSSWDLSQAKAAIQKRSKFHTSVDDKILRKKRDTMRSNDVVEEGIVGLERGTDGLDDGRGDEGDGEDEWVNESGGESEAQVEEEAEAEDGTDGGDGDDESEASEDAESDDSDGPEDVVNEKRKKDYFDEPPPPNPLAHEVKSFTSLNLSRPIMRAVTALGFVEPTLVQARTIPLALQGRDICGSAVTGSGKTAAFMIPILERLLFRPTQAPQTRVLVLVPTRELGVQVHSVATNLAKFTDIKLCLCVGGLNAKLQETELRKRPDIVVATTGRLIDHMRNAAGFGLDGLEILVIDEADRILDEGFKDELNEIMEHTPRSRQTMLFSATMTDDVDLLVRLHMSKPIRLFIDPNKSITTNLTQEFIRIRQQKEVDRAAVLAALCARTYKTRCIIFFRAKKSAHHTKIVFGFLGLKAAELHGDLTQLQRLEALEDFRDEKVDFLMATDLAARGLDVAGIETVVNYDMPKNYNQYVHRVGRTARGTTMGRAVSLVGEHDRPILKLAIKNSRSGVKHRLIPPEAIAKYKEKIESMRSEIDAVLQEEKEEKLMDQTDMQATKAENLIKHHDEIVARPAKTWFQSEKEKQASKDGANSGDAGESKKRKRQDDDDGKPKRSKLDGLSRAKKRRAKMLEEEKPNIVHARAAAHRAKSAVKPKRMPKLATGDEERPAKGASSPGRGKKRDKKKGGVKQLRAGFRKEIGVHGESRGSERASSKSGPKKSFGASPSKGGKKSFGKVGSGGKNTHKGKGKVKVGKGKVKVGKGKAKRR